MGCLSLWKKWIRPLMAALYFVLMVIAIPLCIIELHRVNAPRHVKAWFIGGIFVLMAVPISLWGIIQHLINYTKPDLQRCIIRILWMVPIYALNAWFALRFPGAAIYLDTARECYEAYVIYSFMSYLLNYLWTEYPRLDEVLKGKAPVKHICPLCWLPPWRNGGDFIIRCKHGVLQYTIVRPVTTVIALICEWAGKYDEGDFNFTSAWSYLVIVNNISQIWAMYSLVLFYKATKEELKPIKPIPKFLCVKFVVFFSFWQAVLIAAMTKLNWIPTGGTWVFYKDTKEIATGIQDFCICIEMFLAAIAHYFSFSHHPYVDSAAGQSNCCQSFVSMWDVSDVTDDVVEHVRVIGDTISKTVSKPNMRKGVEEERIPLLDVNSSSDAKSMGYGGDPTTPPVHVTIKSDTLSVYTDWDGSSIDRQEEFQNKSISPSMNNYLEFGTSVDIGGSEKVESDIPDTSENDKSKQTTNNIDERHDSDTAVKQFVSVNVSAGADSPQMEQDFDQFPNVRSNISQEGLNQGTVSGADSSQEENITNSEVPKV